MAEILLQDDMSDINKQDDEYDSPLHWAVI